MGNKNPTCFLALKTISNLRNILRTHSPIHIVETLLNRIQTISNAVKR